MQLRSVLLGVAAGLSVCAGAFGISIIAVIRADLWFYSGWWWSNSWYYDSVSDTCYMTTNEVSANMCSYGYVVGAVIIFVACISFFSQLSKLRVATGYAYAVDLGATLFGVIWTLPFAVSTTVYGHRATDAGLPFAQQRRAIWALGWSCFACFLYNAVAAVKTFLDARKATRPQPPQGGAYTQAAGIPYGSGPPPSYGSGPPPSYAPPPPPPTGYAVDDYAYGNPVYGSPVYPPQQQQQQQPSGKPGASGVNQI